MKRTREVSAPQGLRRWLYRLPIILFRLRLGRLLGSRFLLLHHRGRRSGLPRTAALEIVRQDRAVGLWIVASGFGERSDWYRNLVAQPDVEIEVGGTRRAVRARVIESDDAEAEMVDYGHRNPTAVKGVARLVGLELDGSEADSRAFSHEIRLVAFERR